MGKNSFEERSNEELLQRLRNAERAIRENTKYADGAATLINQIHQEWSKRASENRFDKVTVKGFSLLEFVGYHVGKERGLKQQAREEKLLWVLKNTLPPVGSPEDYFKWGNPKTQQRLNKLQRTLKGRLGNYKSDAHEQAREETNRDLEFISGLDFEI